MFTCHTSQEVCEVQEMYSSDSTPQVQQGY